MPSCHDPFPVSLPKEGLAGKSSVGFSGNEDEVDLEFLRARLRKMSDLELQCEVRAPQSVSSPNFAKLPRELFLIQLEEARREWDHRKLRDSS